MNKREAPTVSHTSTDALRGMQGTVIIDEAAFHDGSAADEERPKLPKGAVWQDDGTVRLTLRDPVAQVIQEQGGHDTEHKVTNVVFRPLTGAAMLRIQSAKDDGKRALIMMQESSRLPGFTGEDIFRRMDARDFVASTLIASIFTNPGL